MRDCLRAEWTERIVEVVTTDLITTQAGQRVAKGAAWKERGTGNTCGVAKVVARDALGTYSCRSADRTVVQTRQARRARNVETGFAGQARGSIARRATKSTARAIVAAEEEGRSTVGANDVWLTAKAVWVDSRARVTAPCIKVLSNCTRQTGCKWGAWWTRTELTGVGGIEEVADWTAQTLRGAVTGETGVGTGKTTARRKIILSQTEDTRRAFADLAARLKWWTRIAGIVD